ncbi:hypothetical protein ORJ04_20800 [Rheinheimera baltica]|uniref:Uncharacterized protein n=1 Tax=Rheinheimera baltica TaxID=67576 RepID=A0ABT9I4T5_9GAMM|nr:hypothetical protein [Rheinheimera baltica]MDP5138392.1 hypothetical protein [Rheinheimera baltica]
MGKYTIFGEGVESHPSSIIYLTGKYLKNAAPVKPIAVISDYSIVSLECLDDASITTIIY